MRLAELTLGFLVVLFSILGYQYSSSLVDAAQHMMSDFVTAFFPTIKLQCQKSYLLQTAYPSADSIAKIIQVGFIATTIIGVGCVCFGAIMKKPASRQFSSISLETKLIPAAVESIRDNRLTNSKSISILKERLAKGEITERECEKLQRFFEK